jgi:sugar phosphate isomerase/epimerase
MRVGIDNYCYHEQLAPNGPWLVDDFLRRAAELRVDGVSLETAFLPSREIDFLRRLRDRLDTLHFDRVLAWGHPDGLQGGKRREAADEITEYLRCAVVLGAKTMRIVAGSYRTFHEDHGEQILNVVEILRGIVPQAEALGVVLALENHLDFTSAEVLRIVEDVHSPFLRITYDSGNAYRLGENPVEAARRVGPYVAATHIKDVIEGPAAADRPVTRWPSVPLGSGLIDLPGVFLALVAAGYTGMLCVEIDFLQWDGGSRDVAVARSVEYLRDTVRLGKPT